MSQGRPQPPLCYRLIRDASAQSETFGVLLLLAITVVGSTAIITLGSQAMRDTEQASHLQRTEHTMTLLDSRGAMVALGDSSQQEVRFSGSGDGTFRVEEGTGWIAITHNNHSAHGDDEELYNESLGKLVYENGGTEIVYQGGGVWRTGQEGKAQMISKPEFHYRGATLTLPIIRIMGSGSAAGDVRATLSTEDEPRRIFPNASTKGSSKEQGSPYNESVGGGRAYSNPIQNGTINVTVKSEYYEAWAVYFETRTTSNVTVYDSNQTVEMELLTLTDVGDFEGLSDSVGVGGYPDGHTVTNFSVMLQNDNKGDGTFGSMHWSFWADSGNQKFEMHVTPNGKCSEVESGTADVEISYFFENASSSQSQEWVNQNVANSSDAIEDIDCSGDYDTITVNFTAANTNLEYRAVPSAPTSKYYFSDDYASEGGDGPGKITFDQHDADDSRSAAPYVPGSGHQENMSFILGHYFALLGPTFELNGNNGPGMSNRINEDESRGTLEYNQGGGKFLTYLHITENDVEVELG